MGRGILIIRRDVPRRGRPRKGQEQKVDPEGNWKPPAGCIPPRRLNPCMREGHDGVEKWANDSRTEVGYECSRCRHRWRQNVRPT